MAGMVYITIILDVKPDFVPKKVLKGHFWGATEKISQFFGKIEKWPVNGHIESRASWKAGNVYVTIISGKETVSNVKYTPRYVISGVSAKICD